MKTVIGQNLSVVVNQGKTAFEARFRDQLIRWLLASRLFISFLLPQKPAQFHPRFV